MSDFWRPRLPSRSAAGWQRRLIGATCQAVANIFVLCIVWNLKRQTKSTRLFFISIIMPFVWKIFTPGARPDLLPRVQPGQQAGQPGPLPHWGHLQLLLRLCPPLQSHHQTSSRCHHRIIFFDQGMCISVYGMIFEGYIIVDSPRAACEYIPGSSFCRLSSILHWENAQNGFSKIRSSRGWGGCQEGLPQIHSFKVQNGMDMILF